MSTMGALKRQTAQFINEDPTVIVLNRNVKAADGAGGYLETPTPQLAQSVKIVQQSANAATERRNAAGEVVRPSITIVALWDANIERDDTFQWNGLNCEVVWVTDLKYVKHGEVSVL